MILLTGATGMVGRQVAQLLFSRGEPVAALVRDPATAPWLSERGAALVTSPIDDPATWTGIDGVRAIVHAAAIINGGKSWEAYAGANIRATALAAARARSLGVPFIHLSSVAVYGGSTTEPIGTVAEDFPSRPMERGNWYGRSKRDAELAVWREAERGLQAIALRPCVIYGPHDRHFFPVLMAASRRGRLPLIGDGTRPMALVHARSVAEAVVAALDAKSGWGRPYNVTGDGKIAPVEVVAALARGVGHPIRTRRLPEAPVLAFARGIDLLGRYLFPPGRFPGSVTTAFGYWRGGDPYRSEAIRKELGWAPVIDHAVEIERLARESSSPPAPAPAGGIGRG